MTDKPTHTTPTTAFSGNWESAADVIADFEINPDALAGAYIIAAHYETGNWEGSAFLLFEKDGNLYEVQGSHCSCYGLEGQWAPEIGTPESLIHRAKACNGGYPMYQAAEKVLAYQFANSTHCPKEAPMTAELDMSPEAVERLAEALGAQEQADMDGTMVKVSRQACDEGAATIRALAAENARLRAERDAAGQAGAEAMRKGGSLMDLLKRADEIDPVLEVEFDTQRCVEQNPYGATEAIEKALYLIRDLRSAIRALPIEDLIRDLRSAIRALPIEDKPLQSV